MIYTIEFGKLKAMLLDFVDEGNDGCYFLRLVGDEPTVNAIWARLSSRETRGKAWSSGVQIQIPGRSYPEYVALQSGVTYKTVRSRLPSGMIDLALLHPELTLAEDDEFGFYVLSYAEGVPAGFFDRLNRTLAIPLKPEWTEWLWMAGQEPQSRMRLEEKSNYSGGQEKTETILTETTDIPIKRLKSLGQVACYSVHTGDRYRDAWLHLIRAHLKLGIRMTAPAAGPAKYVADPWSIVLKGVGEGAWQLLNNGVVQIEEASLNYLLTQAREQLGVNLLLPGSG